MIQQNYRAHIKLNSISLNIVYIYMPKALV